MTGKKVPAMGLVIRRGGKVYVMANAEEQWVFPLPGSHGFLFYDGEDEALWAPSLKGLVITYLRNAIAETEAVIKRFMAELEKEKERRDEFGVNYWRQQIEQATTTLAEYSKLLDAVEREKAAVKLVGFEEIQRLTEEMEVIG